MDKQAFVSGNKVTQQRMEWLLSAVENEFGKISRESGLWGIISFDPSTVIPLDLTIALDIATIAVGLAYTRDGRRLELSTPLDIDFNNPVRTINMGSGDIVEVDQMVSGKVYVYLREYYTEHDFLPDFFNVSRPSRYMVSSRYFVDTNPPSTLNTTLLRQSICIGAITVGGSEDLDIRDSLYQDASLAHYYNIKDLFSALFAGGGSGTGIYEKTGALVRLAGALANYQEDFVHGSTGLNDTGNPIHDSRFMFDKLMSSFRAGIVDGTQWDTRGIGSVAFGKNNIASGVYSVATGEGANATQDYQIAHGIDKIGNKQFTENQLVGYDNALVFNMTVDGGTTGITILSGRSYQIEAIVVANNNTWNSPIHTIMRLTVMYDGFSFIVGPNAHCDNIEISTDNVTFDSDFSGNDFQIKVNNPNAVQLDLTAKVNIVEHVI